MHFHFSFDTKETTRDEFVRALRAMAGLAPRAAIEEFLADYSQPQANIQVTGEFAEALDRPTATEAAAEHEARTGRPAPVITIPNKTATEVRETPPPDTSGVQQSAEDIVAPAVEAAAEAATKPRFNPDTLPADTKMTPNGIPAPLAVAMAQVPGLPARGRNAIIKAGYGTVFSLMVLTTKEVKGLKDVGADTVKCLNEYLAKYGQGFAETRESTVTPTTTTPPTPPTPADEPGADDPALDRPNIPAEAQASTPPAANNPFGVPASAPAPTPPAPVEGEISDAALREALAKVHSAKGKGLTAAQAVITKFGVVKLPDIPQEKRAEFLKACEEAAAA